MCAENPLCKSSNILWIITYIVIQEIKHFLVLFFHNKSATSEYLGEFITGRVKGIEWYGFILDTVTNMHGSQLL